MLGKAKIAHRVIRCHVVMLLNIDWNRYGFLIKLSNRLLLHKYVLSEINSARFAKWSDDTLMWNG